MSCLHTYLVTKNWQVVCTVSGFAKHLSLLFGSGRCECSCMIYTWSLSSLFITSPSTSLDSLVLSLPSSFFLFLCIPSPSLYILSPPPLLLPPAPPGQVNNTTVRSENLSLRRTQLTWYAPASNNAAITNYWITYCISIMVSINDTCVRPTTIPVFDSTEKPMVNLTDINPERRYRVTIQAENAVSMGPESQSYFFDGASAGRCL